MCKTDLNGIKQVSFESVFVWGFSEFLLHVWDMENVWPAEKLTNQELLSQCVKKDLSSALCGIYLLIKGQKITYIGQSVDVEVRVRSHCSNPDFGKFDYYLMYPCEKKDLTKYERLFIERFFPKHNNDGKTISKKVKLFTARLKLKENKDKHEQFISDVLADVPFENRVRFMKQIEHRFFDDQCVLKTPL